jgi:phenylalanyl-tRNA synthetase beta chain
MSMYATPPQSIPPIAPVGQQNVFIGKQQIGVIGELHPLVVEQVGLRVERDQPVLAADISIAALLPHIPFHYPFDPISPYPAVREDIALVVDQDVTAEAVEEVIRVSGGFLLKDTTLFDVYAGKQLPAGKKSLAYHLTFQAPNKT